MAGKRVDNTMTLLNLSKQDRIATVSLTADELIILCGALHEYTRHNEKPIIYKLYAGLMMIRDLTEYGHIDNVCFDMVADCYKRKRELKNNIAKSQGISVEETW